MPDRPRLIIFGHARSGSSSLYQILQSQKRRVVSLKEGMDFYEDFLATRPEVSYLKLVYEDLYLGGVEQCEAWLSCIWQFLALEPVASSTIQRYLDPKHARLNSSATYRLLPNAHEIDQQLGSDEFGRLFQKPN